MATALDRSKANMGKNPVVSFLRAFWCAQGSGSLKFRSRNNPFDRVKDFDVRSPNCLPEITDKVCVKLTAAGEESEITAFWSTKTCARVLNGKWPCSENFSRIRAALCDNVEFPRVASGPPAKENDGLLIEIGKEKNVLALGWEFVSAGVYLATGSRLTDIRLAIKRKGRKGWCVVDRETGRQFASDDTLAAAQCLATAIANQRLCR